MIYFAQMRTGGAIKIGYARNAKQRFGQLQIGNSTTLHCLALIEGSEEQEAQLHERFRVANTRGEWFKPTKELLSYIQSLTSVDKIKDIKPTGRRLASKEFNCTDTGISVRLPASLLAQIDSLAEQERRTRGNLIRLLLEEALEKRQ